jgi:OmcA/MtrC family decaheme c-type cytochrome
VDFKVIIHKIHAGEHLQNGFILGGNPSPTPANPGGNPVDFSHIRFPNDLANCEACHMSGTYALPEYGRGLPSLFEFRECTEDPAADADDYCTNPFWVQTATMTLPPATAACTGCHDTETTAVHAELNTALGGREACANCHGPGSTWDVEVVHSRR